MRPPLHSRVPSADIGALNLHEYFSPLSAGLNNSHNPPQSSHASKEGLSQGKTACQYGRHTLLAMQIATSLRRLSQKHRLMITSLIGGFWAEKKSLHFSASTVKCLTSICDRS